MSVETEWSERIVAATQPGSEGCRPSRTSERGRWPCHTHISMRPFFVDANRLMQICAPRASVSLLQTISALLASVRPDRHYFCQCY